MGFIASLKFAGAVAVCTIVLTVPAAEGAIDAPAHAKKRCGGDGQRACTIFERPGRPCDRGLKQIARSGLDLGKCGRTTTKAPSQNVTNHRNPPPRNAEVLPMPRIRDDGRYNDHGGQTGIKLCNKSNTPMIHAAIGYYDWGIYGDRPNWSSAGWWSIRKGQCVEVGLIDDYEAYDDAVPYAGQVYLMAHGGGLAWEGNGGSFCVRRGSEFRIKDADRRRCSEENTLYDVEFIVNPGALNHFDFDA